MRGKANTANRLTDGQSKFDEGGRGNHEEKIGCAIHGMLADVPDNAVTIRKMLGITHEHGGIFKRRDGKIHIARGVIKRGCDEEEGDEKIEGKFF